MSAEKLELYITTADLCSLEALLKHEPTLAKSHTSRQVSPLILSCYYKNTEITNLLFQYVDHVNLFEAAALGKMGEVAHLLYAHPEAINFYAEDGFTTLGLACYFGHFEVSRYLAQKGADVNLHSNNGFKVYPLHSAVSGNYNDIAVMLVENGAHVNVKQEAGATPLHLAAQNGNIDLLIMLLENGADVNISMDNGKIAADLARENGFLEIAEALV